MRRERKQLYEGMYIVSATLSDDARQKMVERLKGQITEFGGEVRKVFDWGRRRLAYAIDGRKEGYYFIFYFTAPTHSLTELWREYHLNEDLVRFMTLRAEEVPEKIEFKQLAEVGINV